jgi:hypothetical protein
VLGSEHSSTHGNVPVGGEEDYVPGAIGNAEYQHLALETGDPLRREVDDGDDLATDQRLRLVVCGELGARASGSDGSTEIDHQLNRGLAGLRKRFGLHNPSDPYVHLVEVIPGYLCHVVSSGLKKVAISPTSLQKQRRATLHGEVLVDHERREMAFTYIHTCYRILDPEKSEDFYVNKMGSLFRERKVS